MLRPILHFPNVCLGSSNKHLPAGMYRRGFEGAHILASSRDCSFGLSFYGLVKKCAGSSANDGS